MKVQQKFNDTHKKFYFKKLFSIDILNTVGISFYYSREILTEIAIEQGNSWQVCATNIEIEDIIGNNLILIF